ncbi:SGNH/GDSL hydrolase family protein [Nocardioides sp. Leaf307]|uniref:SGNH/GDSL hydrolase family protein n=1 Tax=Nocardioides sp. Leaf307 TaxID=1736331 RepID=UPI000702DAC4|nr:SGNH/GDSL hydrolase family protein [Nocardioides sp. Leaf307]KQQ39522.1 hypothetical protein ASF50_16545 [Nocardioides sp. Leaf307]
MTARPSARPSRRAAAPARPATLRLAAALAAGALLVTGCSSSGGDEPDDTAAPSPETSSSAPSTSPSTSPGSTADAGEGSGDFPRYVALGDSYTAAPLVPDTDPQDGCLRSTGNYPSLVAAAIDGTALTDVSCSGATTTSLVGVQETFDGQARPAQFDALTEDTDLVTLGMGGNDFNLFATLIGRCGQLAAEDPDGSPCEDADLVKDNVFRQIRGQLAAALTGVLDRSPDARVLAVGYPQILPAEGTCPDRIDLAVGDYPYARDLNERLDAAVEGAAKDAGVDFVDAFAATEGHDLCAEDPWINGRTTLEDEALAYHPLAAEQEAVAAEVLAVLGQD